MTHKNNSRPKYLKLPICQKVIIMFEVNHNIVTCNIVSNSDKTDKPEKSNQTRNYPTFFGSNQKVRKPNRLVWCLIFNFEIQ